MSHRIIKKFGLDQGLPGGQTGAKRRHSRATASIRNAEIGLISLKEWDDLTLY